MVALRLQHRAGYTLLEVLIALALLSVLVAMIAGLMSVFSRAEATAQRAARDLRVLRSVRHQLTFDLERLDVPSALLLEQQGSPEGSVPANTDVIPEGTSSDFDETVLDEGAFGDAVSEQTPSSFSDGSGGRARGSVGEGVSFLGTPFGFRCRVRLSSDPAMWFQSLISPPGLDEEPSSFAATSRDSLGTRSAKTSSDAFPVEESAFAGSSDSAASVSSLLAEQIGQLPVTTFGELEYRLSQDLDFPGMGRGLVRRLSPQSPPSLKPLKSGSESVLGTAELYRAENAMDSEPLLSVDSEWSPMGMESESLELNFEATERSSPSVSQEPLQADRVRNACFRYSDGVDWYRSWDAAKRGGPPVAIELTFDLDRGQSGSSETNALNSRQDNLLDTSDDDRLTEDGSETSGLSDETFDPFAMNEESTESLTEPDRDATPRDTEVRWVIGIVGAEPTARSDGLSEGSAGSNDRNRGLDSSGAPGVLP